MASKPTQGSGKRSTGSTGGASRNGSSRSSGNGSKRTTAASRSAAASKAAKTRAASGSGSRSTRSASSRSSSSRSSSSRSSSNATRSPQTRSGTANKSNGVTGTLKDAATKAKGPAVAVGAAAAGLAGGLVLKGRMGRKKVLGVPVPRSLPELDMKSVAKSVGDASKRFAKSSKSVSKDLERAGDQAERIGKILG